MLETSARSLSGGIWTIWETPSKERDTGNAGIPWRNPALNSPQSLIQRASTQVPTQVPFVPFVFTFLPREAAEPSLSPGSLLYALNCFNMSEYMSDEHVLGTPGAPPCRATCPASEPGRATCPASEPHASPPSHTDHTDHTVIRSYGHTAAWHCATCRACPA